MKFLESVIFQAGLASITILFLLIFSELAIRFNFSETILDETKTKITCSDKGSKGYLEKDECYGKYNTISKMVFYSKAGYISRPNHSGNGYKINSLSQRADQDPSPNMTNVFITGGSAAWGAGVKQNDLFTNRASRILGAPFEVFSSGQGGYLIANEIDYFFDVLKSQKPKLWISFSGWNDVYAAMERGHSYYINPDIFALGPFIYDANSKSTAPIEHFPKTTKSRDTNENFWKYRYKDYRLKSLWLLEKKIAQFKRDETKLQKYQVPAQATYSVDDFVENFLQQVRIAHLIAKENGICFSFVLQPDLYSTSKSLSGREQELISAYQKRFKSLGQKFKQVYPLLHRGLKKLSEELSFNYIDADSKISKYEDTFFVDHVHFGSKGSLILGELIAEHIKASLLKCKS